MHPVICGADGFCLVGVSDALSQFGAFGLLYPPQQRDGRKCHFIQVYGFFFFLMKPLFLEQCQVHRK